MAQAGISPFPGRRVLGWLSVPSLIVDVGISATKQTLSISAYDAAVALDAFITTSTSLLHLYPWDTTILLDTDVVATKQSLYITPKEVGLLYDVEINVEYDKLQLYRHTASIDYGIVRETGWKADRNLGAWDFIPQPDKYGYLNNKTWTNSLSYKQYAENKGLPIDLTDKHFPCGHWHKRPTEPEAE
jgi:hypothetical protein